MPPEPKKPRVRRAPRTPATEQQAPAAGKAWFSDTHHQLLLYAKDLNRLLKSERRKSRELAATHQQLLKYARDLKQSYEAEKKRAREVRAAYTEAIGRLTVAAEYKDEDTAHHIQRISHYSRALARELGWPDAQVELIYEAAPMHDVGKIGVPDAILLKPGALSADEWDVMKTHALIGENILARSPSPLLKMAAEIAASHHERWDGSGYPHGLKNGAIPITGRIVALADVYDALRSQRPYKPPFDHARACDIILNGDGRTAPVHFDPALLDVFARNQGKFARIYNTLADA